MERGSVLELRRSLEVTSICFAVAAAMLACDDNGAHPDKSTNTPAVTVLRTASQRESNPPAYTPAPIRTQDNPTTDEKAIDIASRVIGTFGGVSSFRSANVKSVAYVRTSAGAGAAFLGLGLPDPVPPDASAWAFVAYGDFQDFSPSAGLTPVMHEESVLVMTGLGTPTGSLTNNEYDLNLLGTPVTIPPGQVPAIDAVRSSGNAATATP